MCAWSSSRLNFISDNSNSSLCCCIKLPRDFALFVCSDSTFKFISSTSRIWFLLQFSSSLLNADFSDSDFSFNSFSAFSKCRIDFSSLSNNNFMFSSWFKSSTLAVSKLRFRSKFLSFSSLSFCASYRSSWRSLLVLSSESFASIKSFSVLSRRDSRTRNLDLHSETFLSMLSLSVLTRSRHSSDINFSAKTFWYLSSNSANSIRVTLPSSFLVRESIFVSTALYSFKATIPHSTLFCKAAYFSLTCWWFSTVTISSWMTRRIALISTDRRSTSTFGTVSWAILLFSRCMTLFSLIIASDWFFISSLSLRFSATAPSCLSWILFSRISSKSDAYFNWLTSFSKPLRASFWALIVCFWTSIFLSSASFLVCTICNCVLLNWSFSSKIALACLKFWKSAA